VLENPQLPFASALSTLDPQPSTVSMPDYFALLDQPRRPWLEPEELKQKFLALSAAHHPDRVHAATEPEKRAAQQTYTEFNAAYQCLREPRERLRHLLELERGAKPETVQRIPPELMDFSLEVSRLCRDTDKFLAEKAALASPLLLVQLFERGQAWTEKLQGLQRLIQSHNEEAEAQLKKIDAAWTGASSPGSPERQAVLPRLEELWRLLSYFARWNSQLAERIMQLSL
jgi:DnaJ-domain-containing protein 1